MGGFFVVEVDKPGDKTCRGVMSRTTSRDMAVSPQNLAGAVAA
jgi:hypothetical protein